MGNGKGSIYIVDAFHGVDMLISDLRAPVMETFTLWSIDHGNHWSKGMSFGVIANRATARPRLSPGKTTNLSWEYDGQESQMMNDKTF